MRRGQSSEVSTSIPVNERVVCNLREVSRYYQLYLTEMRRRRRWYKLHLSQQPSALPFKVRRTYLLRVMGRRTPH